ncbi:putative pyruvate decarboxylase [Dunaliella salina]|uniref:pyruvate decarboxylase n=1 Tax=Dunaliella salina TaxID=3046 RepID=A0ABQ7GEN5_DUNSA|nr:putative pyruvate decarboxylase [Dunaliella salina]|eukprot:KAF5833071.1 putative pyruvate decarboxylase [Dunaliella salina]
MCNGQLQVELGCTTAFGVPGDFNLLLLDQLLKHPQLQMVWCCNELNAGYAADGYARRKGIGCCVVTFSVGGFSALNAIAGAMSEDLPVIVISGVPNSNDYAQNRVLHHTTGMTNPASGGFNQQLRCFKEVTCYQATLNHVEDAHRLIDEAISAALVRKKPAYIEVCCNLADATHPSFTRPPVPYMLPHAHTNPHSCQAAVDAVGEVLDKAIKPVLLAGPRLRHGRERDAFLELAQSSKYAVAIQPDAKGMVPEDLQNFIGLYWGSISWPCVCEIVESADVVVCCGTIWTDYSTVGYSLLLRPDHIINVGDHRVTVKSGATYGCITSEHFLSALAKRVQPNPTAVTAFQRMSTPTPPPGRQDPNEQLQVKVLFKHIQEMLTPSYCVLSEVGDSWFNTQKLRLPRGCDYEMQMRYGSIGWSVGATLGYAAACAPSVSDIKACNIAPAGAPGADGPDVEAIEQPNQQAHMAESQATRVISLIGDGSFQMTCQDVSTMLRYGLNPIIFLINNLSYTIEVQIHDGPYNAIMNWDYEGMVKCLNNGQGRLWTAKVQTEEQLEDAIGKATNEHKNDLCFIKVIVDRDDCSKELLEWGTRVGAANGRPHSSH